MAQSIDDSVARLKIVEALRKDDPSELQQVAKVYNVAAAKGLLKLAVQTSKAPVLKFVLELYSQSGRDINEQDESDGDTPLHVAARYNNLDAAALLERQPTINDTIANHEDLTAYECAKSPEMERLLASAQNEFVQHTSVAIKKAFDKQDLKTLQRLFANPRVAELIDVNGTDPETGSTVLHAAAKNGNLELVKFILDNKGDPMVRDRNHKTPIEVATDPKVQHLLATTARAHAIEHGSASKSPSESGFLKKWTNYTSGYKARWFVLSGGVLKYYKSPEDVSDYSCRGSVPLANARVRLQSSERRRFELRTPTTKLLLKAQHPVEANRWVWALQNAITAAKETAKTDNADAKSVSSTVSKKRSGLLRRHNHSGSFASVSSKRSATHAHQPAPQPAQPPSATPSRVNTPDPSAHPHHAHQQLKDSSGTGILGYERFIVDDLHPTVEDSNSTDDDDDEDLDTQLQFPRGASADAIMVQLDAIAELLQGLGQKIGPSADEAVNLGLSQIREVSKELPVFKEYIRKESARVNALLARSENQQKFWAQNCRTLEIKLERAESQLYSLQNPEPTDDDDNEEFYDTVDEWHDAEKGEPHNYTEPHLAKIDEKSTPSQTSESTGAAGAAAAGGVAAAAASGATAEAVGSEPQPASQETQPASHETQPETAETAEPVGAADQSEPSADAATGKHETEGLTEEQAEVQTAIDQTKSFAGYEDPPRKKLAIDADNRPKISLWGVLKSLIGKDMTKMTLPVSFNECTNLLQRSAEDMEYVDLLDRAAAAVDDPGLRMAYVAAFAASSYSSTIGRVAKPFNPLLGETFEYCRPDLDFRFMSEQVSHHPPIGALLAQSPRWDFYGHSNVKSKFYGRSFDIVPTGLWYLNLRPDKGAEVEEELYTFRKVTSSVIGIMVGSPEVDNYGVMDIHNHTTGVTCKLHFKQRGWKASSAYKVEGHVVDKNGTELYTVSGTWNDQIVAKKAGAKGGLKLWHVHERPRAPFNLTPFAITLNALPESLKPWLPPTDTRYRPDQRAMEEAEYDLAREEKQRVEEKQREARRRREETGESYKPCWYELAKHPVTGEEYYKPINDYWGKRAKHDLEECPNIF